MPLHVVGLADSVVDGIDLENQRVVKTEVKSVDLLGRKLLLPDVLDRGRKHLFAEVLVDKAS